MSVVAPEPSARRDHRAIAHENAAVARALAQELARCGLRDCCVAPGSRSTPLVLALGDEPSIRLWTVTDERAGGFFALGMARALDRPVAMLCTSGTAAANLLPAAAEAALSEVPLLLLTADRPPELRDCRAPQTIDQVGIYGSHVRWSVDLPAPAPGLDLDSHYRMAACRAMAVAMGSPAGPVHVNAPFRDPLMVEPHGEAATEDRGRESGEPWTTVHRPSVASDGATVAALATSCTARHGLVVCGAGTARDDEEAQAVCELAAQLGWPVLADPLSGLRFGGHDKSGLIDAYDVLLRSERFRAAHRPDSVLRLGRLPASRALTAFLSELSTARQIVVASAGTWPDPTHRASDLVHAEPVSLVRQLAAAARPSGSTAWREAWIRANASAREVLAQRVAAALEESDTSWEGAIPAALLACLPIGGLLQAGNSMPIRDLDTFGGVLDRRIDIVANRGTNGIDGVLSTALGAAASSTRRVALLIGDLSFLHDIGGLQIAARHGLDLLVIVVNNDGGGIFSFLPQSRLGERFDEWFATPHGLDLEPAVRMCRGQWRRVSRGRDLAQTLAQSTGERGLTVVEVSSDRARNVEQHRGAIAAAIARLEADASITGTRA